MSSDASLSEKFPASGSTLRQCSLLALTLGERVSWALHQRDGITKQGHALFRSSSFEGIGMGFLRFRYFLDDLHKNAGNLDAVVFADVRDHATTHAAMIFGGYFAHLTAWCEWRYVPYLNASLATAKKIATGYDNPNFQSLVEALRRRGYTAADRESAEALALLDWALRYENRSYT